MVFLQIRLWDAGVKENVLYPSDIQNTQLNRCVSSQFLCYKYILSKISLPLQGRNHFTTIIYIPLHWHGILKAAGCKCYRISRISLSQTLLELKFKPLDEAVYFRGLLLSWLPCCWIYLLCSLLWAQISFIFVCWWSLGPASQLILELPQNLGIVSHGTAVVPKGWAAGRRAGIWTSWKNNSLTGHVKL